MGKGGGFLLQEHYTGFSQWILFRMEARAQIKSNLDKDEDDEATDLENNNEFFITEPVS